MSLMPYFNMVIRSIPIPKAKPLYSKELILQASKTLGWTMPQPNTSYQPVPFVRRRFSSVSNPAQISISALGSVKGK